MSAKFFGKYRGVVTNDIDPMQIGRVQVQVAGVFRPAQSAWAMPCVPCNHPSKVGSSLPKIGAMVWIEFEQGDSESPIWTGCFYTNAGMTPACLRNTK
jgi:hypothetical protein